MYSTSYVDIRHILCNLLYLEIEMNDALLVNVSTSHTDIEIDNEHSHMGAVAFAGKFRRD